MRIIRLLNVDGDLVVDSFFEFVIRRENVFDTIWKSIWNSHWPGCAMDQLNNINKLSTKYHGGLTSTLIQEVFCANWQLYSPLVDHWMDQKQALVHARK